MPKLRPFRWRKTDESDDVRHCPDHSERELYYARVYTVRQGFMFSDTNDQIFNLKMSPNLPDARLHYKDIAIRRFAGELASFLEVHGDEQFALIPMPPSKTPDSPEYDDRVVRVAELVAEQCSHAEMAPILDAVRDIEPVHERGRPRDVEELVGAIGVDVAQVKALAKRPDVVVAIVDDILTSGAHFAAAVRLLEPVLPEHRIIGLFWAKAEELDKDE